MKYLLIMNQNLHKSNFHFFTFFMDCMSPIFYKYIFMLIKQNKNTSSSISFYYLLNSYLIFLFCFVKESSHVPRICSTWKWKCLQTFCLCIFRLTPPQLHIYSMVISQCKTGQPTTKVTTIIVIIFWQFFNNLAQV